MKKISFLQISIFFLLHFGCNKNIDLPIQKGSIQFTVNNITFSNLKSTNSSVYVLVSIKDKDGNLVYSLQENELYLFEENYISKPFTLNPGEYTLSEFFVLDGNKEIIYAAPISGSKMAELVETPLEVSFSISKDKISKLTPEVIRVENKIPEDFGYVSFGFDTIETFDFLLSVFIYDTTTNNFELTDALLNIESAEKKIINTATLEAKTNNITTKDGFENYILNIIKGGYPNYSFTISSDSLKKHLNEPLIIIMQSEYTLILQPEGDEGKDAQVWSWDPTGSLDRGTNRTDIVIYEWTKNGASTTKYGLIDFNLSRINPEAKIKEAKLSLYYDSTSVDDGHSQLSGSNEAVIQRIISPWEENVSWNDKPLSTDINEVYLEASISETQDYLDIDITKIVQDYISDYENSYGFLIKMIIHEPYRSLVFASSEHPDFSKHPKLEITYSY